MALLRRPDVTLHYDDTGPREGPVVVLTHSLLCDGSMFAHLAAALAQRYRVLNVDLRGHGRSSPSRRDYTLEDQAQDLVALLDAVNAPKAHLVGLSMGAMTSLRVALWHPSRVRSLCLLDTSAEPESPARRVQYLAMAAVARVFGVVPALQRQVLPLLLTEAWRARHPKETQDLVQGLRRMDRRALVQAVRCVVDRADLSQDLGTLDVPALVVVGEEDRATPPHRSEHLARELRGARLERVPGAGHLSTLEAPEATTKLVLEFLDTLPP
jgi:3-oxoadipate enol-lactonase